MIVSLFIMTLWSASPVWAQSSPSTLAAARLRQEWTPEFRRRKDTAREQINAAEEYFGGDQEVLGTWPELDGVPLLSLPYVQGALLQLDQRAEERNAERIASPPDDLIERDAQRYLKERDAAIDAEEDADQLKRRLLIGIAAGIKRAPLIQQDAIDAQIAVWRSAVADLPPADDPGYAQAAQAARIAGELESILRRYEQAAILAMTVPGDLSLQRLSSADLARQRSTPQTEAEVAAAVDRLRRIAPLLPEDYASRVDEFIDERELIRLDAAIVALQAEQAALVNALEAVSVPDGADRDSLLGGQLAAQQALKDAARVTEDMAPDPDSPLQVRQQQLAMLRHDIAAQQLKLVEAQLSLIPDETMLTAEQSALETLAQADDAAASARAAEDLAEAAGKEELAQIARDLQTLSETLAREASEQHEAANTVLIGLQAKQVQQHDEMLAAFQTPPLVRQQKIQLAYERTLSFISEVRDVVAERQRSARNTAVENAAIRQEQFPSDEDLTRATQLDTALLTSIQASVSAIEDALEGRHHQALLEQDEVVRLLRAARDDARDLRRHLSPVARNQAEQLAQVDFLLGSLSEIEDLSPMLGEQARRVQATDSWTIRGILRRVIVFLESSFGLLIILLLWNVARYRGAHWLEHGLRLLQQISPRETAFQPLLALKLDGLAQRLVPVIRPAVGVIAGWLMFVVLNLSSPLLALLALLWVARAALQFVEPFVEVTLRDRRHALVGGLSRATIRPIATASLRQLLRWWIAAGLLHHTAYAVLRADLLTDRVDSLMLFILMLLLTRELLRWSSLISAALDTSRPSRMVRWATASDGGVLLRLLRAITGLLILTADLARRMSGLFVEGRGRMGWIGSIIAQHSLKEVHSDCPPLTPEERSTLLDTHTEVFLHDEEAEAIGDAYAAWSETDRLGLVAVIGERGAGKSMLMRRIVQEPGDLQHPIRLLHLSGVLEHEQEAREWLCASFGLSCDEKDMPAWRAIRDHLLSIPPQIFLVDDAHRLMLRAVGGFAGLRETLTLMHATSHRHFWVVGFHGPAWSFLEGSAVPINLDVFRSRIRFAPLEPVRVSRWLTDLTNASGMDVHFSNIATGLLNTADSTRDLARIEAAFWRRATDITLGNPEVLLSHWLDSLRHPSKPRLEAEAEAEAEVEVRELMEVALLEPMDIGVIDELPDIDLFVLTGIVIHDGLGVADLSRSLNTGRGQLRSSCRHLEGIGVLEWCGDGQFRVRPRWRPAVSRLLRQRHFLHRR